ncbi:endonuclease/exonuclease/phosphatase family protein [Paenibacillus sp. TRM 82003]|nr:endonuclease/exonuclease/phosphatase family protein [Paenibacillus sp. TRM 82003]MCI3923483.1 endonuclease/exonuclease/phosphatase family protein [Paenibacillus sp. TRM 82003]
MVQLRSNQSCRMIVMSFNLRTATWRDGANAWRYRKGRAAQAIEAAAPDVVGTQEGSVAMIGELADRLPGYAWLGEGRRGGAKDETCAILYREDRWAPEEHGTFWLSETPDRPGSRSWGSSLPRICTWAIFRATGPEAAEPGGNAAGTGIDATDESKVRDVSPTPRIAVFNTHLDHISAAARTRGAKLAAQRIDELRKRTRLPALLTGDFNAKPSAEAIKQLGRPPHAYASAFDAYPGGPRAVGATFHAFRGGGRPGEPIDYVFAAGDVRFGDVTVDRGLYDGRYPSDHYPVRAGVMF